MILTHSRLGGKTHTNHIEARVLNLVDLNSDGS
jgi:hypothetical protein